MKTKHTPGPWQYAFEGGTVAFIVEADGTTVVKLSATENSTAHSHLAANARLIAAAPEMLNALETVNRYLQACIEDNEDAWIIREAMHKQVPTIINQATGENS